MIRILWIFILTVALYWVVKGLFARDQRKSRPDVPGEEMVKDPYCGVYLPRSSAVSIQQGRERLYFCSEECRDKYVDSWRNSGRKVKK